MKKIFTLILLLVATVTAMAEDANTFAFWNNDGKVADGATITVNTLTEDAFGGSFISSGLSVANLSNGDAHLCINYEVTSIDNGAFQICFPTNCIQKNETGSWTTEVGNMTAYDLRSLQCEWLPEAYGQCKVTLKIEEYNSFGTKIADGPSVNVIFDYANPNVQTNWWGYFNESDFAASDNTIGTGSSMALMAAIYIPANHEQLGNATVKGVRVYLDGSVVSKLSDMKVWISTTKPSKIGVADYVQDISQSLVADANDFELTTPFEVNNQGFYIGYYVNSSTGYFIRCGGSGHTANSFWLGNPEAGMGWSDIAADYDFGKLAFQILIEGGNFADYSATPGDISYQVAQLGGDATFDVPITNNGKNAISSIDYTITTDGVASAERHADLTTPITFNGQGNATITVSADNVKGTKTKTLTITKVNGIDNEATNKSVDFTLYTVAELVTHRVVVEEFTGTGCGWCPRGLVGMEKLRNTFGDLFVGIGLHQYNSSDAMYINSTNYAKLNFQGAPSCMIDRRYETDPYYGNGDDICNDFLAVQAIPSLVGVEVEGTWNEDQSKVDAKATVQSLVDGANFNIEYVLIGDGITGTAAGFNQSNYYTQYSASQLPEDLAIFGSGGKYGQSTIKGWIFNDVALSSSYVSGTNKAEKLTNLSSEEPAISEYTLSLPTKNVLKNAIDKEQVYVVALIVDNSGIIVNAAKAKVQPYEGTGIGSVAESQSATVDAYFSPDGRQLSAPQRGLNIVRMSDGTVKKVVIK